MEILLLSIIAGIAAGALTARSIVRRELRDFAERTAGPPAAGPVPPPAPPPVVPVPPGPALAPAQPEELSPEILTVLTAAVAAFLGKRARIRSIRPRSSPGASVWAQQGRVFVQASHNLPLHR